MANDLVFGVKLNGDGTLVGEAKAANAEISNLKKSTDALAVTTGKSAAETARFVAGLERQNALFGKSATEALRYDASMLDMTDTQRAHTNELLATAAANEKQAATQKNVVAELAKGATAVLAYKAVVVNSIRAANEFTAAIMGLASVARFSGEDIGATLNKATDLTTDGLMSTSEAALALKNLLSRGFTADQAIEMINRLKDSAAFGRQASLEFGQAVVSATEGIKNENSILVDNAGVTKNVSVMWKEYAAQIGVTVDSLSQAQKREAEYSGVMRETEGQMGNSALAADSLMGSTARMNKSANDAAVAFGQALTPAAILLADSITWVNESAIKPMIFGVQSIGIVAGKTAGQVGVFIEFMTSPSAWNAKGIENYSKQLEALGALGDEMMTELAAKLNGEVTAPNIDKDSGARRKDVAPAVNIEGAKKLQKDRQDAADYILAYETDLILQKAKAEQDAADYQLAYETDLIVQQYNTEQDQAAKLEEDRKRASERMSQNITDSLMRGFESGKPLAENLADTTENIFKSMVLEPQVKAAVSGMMGMDAFKDTAVTTNTLAIQANTAALTGKAAEDKANSSSSGDWVMAIIAAIYYGFAIGESKRMVGERTTMTATNTSVSGASVQDWEKSRGWFQDVEQWSVATGLSMAQVHKYRAEIAGLTDTFANAGDVIGYTGVRTADFTIQIDTAGDATEALGNSLGSNLLPAIVMFRQEGETLADTAQRLTDTFRSTNDFINAMGVSQGAAFGGFGLGSAAGRDELIAASGGLSAFTQSAQGFVTNFLTPAQQMAPALDDVARTFARLGIEGVTTNEQFAELVKNQMELGNTGVVGELLSVADSFNTITTEAKAANAQINALLNKENFATMVDYQRARAYAANGVTGGQDVGGMIAAALPNVADTLAAEIQGTTDFANANASSISGAIASLVPASSTPTDPDSQWDFFTDWLDRLWNLMSDWLTDFFGLLGDTLTRMAEDMFVTMRDLPKSIMDAFSPIVDQMLAFPTAMNNALVELFSNWAISLKDTASHWVETLKGTADHWVESLKGTASHWVESLRDTGTHWADAIYKKIKGLFGGSDGDIAPGGSLNPINLLSDPRLKEGVTQVGVTKHGLGEYDFSYINDPTHARYRGVMSDEVRRVMPAAVSVGRDGYDRVNYGMLGIQMQKLNSFAVGSNYLPRDMIAQVHEGERIIPKADNMELMSRLKSSPAANDALLVEVRALREDGAKLRAEVARLRKSSEQTAFSTAAQERFLRRISVDGNSITVQVAA